IEELYDFRFFINDLCSNIVSEYRKYNQNKRLVVYHGHSLMKDEILKLKQNEGNLIIFNSYLSTSRSRDVALVFASTSRPNTDTVVFEIHIEPHLKTMSYAATDEHSPFPDEEEVLFNLGVTFKIESVVYDNIPNIWIAKMTGTDDGAKIAHHYMNNDKNGLGVIKRRLINLVEYTKSKKLFKKSLSNTSDNISPDVIDSQHSTVLVIKPVQVVCLDASSDGIKMSVLKNEYQQIFKSSFQYFDDADECQTYLNSNVNKKIYFIMYGDIAERLVWDLHQLSHIYQIYVCCEDAAYYFNWPYQYPKICGVFDDLNHLDAHLKTDIAYYARKQGEKQKQVKSDGAKAKRNYRQATDLYSILIDSLDTRVKQLETDL
ncbi:unnamed protein product, partial [Didymodactylos carnosus]